MTEKTFMAGFGGQGESGHAVGLRANLQNLAIGLNNHSAGGLADDRKRIPLLNYLGVEVVWHNNPTIGGGAFLKRVFRFVFA